LTDLVVAPDLADQVAYVVRQNRQELVENLAKAQRTTA
jgi:hypothetical protein